jgi:Lon protease-like protein
MFERLPIFPLPAVHLFPHALLPLHVFEPRYRALVADCLKGDRVLAVPTLEPGYEPEYAGRPAVKAVCGAGQLIGHELLPDGRSNIVLRGIARVRILAEHEGGVYRVVRAERLVDHQPPTFDSEAAVRTLVLLADRLAASLPSGGDTLRQLTRSTHDAGQLVDVLAAALVSNGADRQALLEEVEVAARVDRVVAHLAAVLRAISPGGARN